MSKRNLRLQYQPDQNTRRARQPHRTCTPSWPQARSPQPAPDSSTAINLLHAGSTSSSKLDLKLQKHSLDKPDHDFAQVCKSVCLPTPSRRLSSLSLCLGASPIPRNSPSRHDIGRSFGRSFNSFRRHTNGMHSHDPTAPRAPTVALAQNSNTPRTSQRDASSPSRP
ncbi:hypothetical protein KC19_VG044700 [Ceratodon purpureus]|uniref:Uncharacterized protein n=1 Tax=Ceratodon purpureus TaxID=3225 RepID=A0A8T0HLW9_CERPU|nr:hypothetical protein KC19_VG044700 [Ceratodon purpureus]